MPLLHGAERPRRHAEFALSLAAGRRNSDFRQCRHRDVGTGRARPRVCRPSCRSRRWTASIGSQASSRSSTPSTGEAPRKTHDESVRQVALAEQIRITKLDLVEGDRDEIARPASPRTSTDQPVGRDRRVDWTSAAVAKLLTSKGFDCGRPPRRSPALAGPRSLSEQRAHTTPADMIIDHDHATIIITTSAILINHLRQGDREFRADPRERRCHARSCNSFSTASRRILARDSCGSRGSSTSPRSQAAPLSFRAPSICCTR